MNAVKYFPAVEIASIVMAVNSFNIDRRVHQNISRSRINRYENTSPAAILGSFTSFCAQALGSGSI